jgi:hypothetical protein
MDRRSSILWIVFLLAALFLGPSVILRKLNSTEATASARVLKPGERSELRILIEQEKLIDAPSSIPDIEDAPEPADIIYAK